MSRDSTTMPRRAVFLDRDGTINYEMGHLGHPERFLLMPRAGEAIRAINEAGWLAIVVSNQSGVGRGFFPLEQLEEVHEHMRRKLSAYGAHLDGIFCCPHAPEDYCSCRKPRPGLIEKAAQEHHIDKSRSWVVGDMARDIETGRRAGCHTALVLTGLGRQAVNHGPRPDLVAEDLYTAVEHILNGNGSLGGSD